MMTGPLQRGLIGMYAIVNRTGILQLPAYRRVFRVCYFLYKRYLEDPLVTLLRICPDLCAGGTVIDVGANLGYTSVLFSKYLDPGRKVIAFEPDRRNYDTLSAVASRHPAIVPVHAAVGAQAGEVLFWSNPAHHGDSRTVTDTFGKTLPPEQVTYAVPLVRLDGYLAERGPAEPISLIKIDVQGYEENVLLGCVGTIERHPDLAVVMEYSPDAARELGFDPESQLRFFRSRGFRLYFLSRKKGLSDFDPEALPRELAGRGYCDVVASRRPLLSGKP